MRLTLINIAILTSFSTFTSNIFANDVSQQTIKTSDDIEVIKIRGTKFEKPLSELTGSVAVISERDIRRSVSTQMSDLFRNEPGVSVTGFSGVSQNISIRGMSGNRILMLQDGTRLADGYGANDINDFVGRSNFDLQDVKQIEVAKGAASSFFGAGALGGVVKITTKQASDYLPNQAYYLDANLLYNDVNSEFKQSITGAKRIASLPVMVKFSNWDGKEQQNSGDSRPPLDISGQSARINTQWDNEVGLLTLNGDWLEQETRNTSRPYSVPQFDGAWLVDDQQRLETQTSTSATVTWQHTTETVWFDEYTAIGFWRETSHENHSTQLLSRTFFDVQRRFRQLVNDDSYKQQSAGIKIDLSKIVGNHEVLYGASYEQLAHERPKLDIRIENGTSTNITSEPFRAATTKTVGFYVSDDVTLNESFNVLVGVRYDSNQLSAKDGEFIDNNSSKLSASAKLTFDSGQGVKMYAGVNQGYRAAPYDKVYGNVPHYFALPPFEIVPNTQLKEETSNSVDVGMSWQIGDVLLSGSVFYNQFDDFIAVEDGVLRQSDGVLERRYVNIDEVITYGAELKMNYQVNDDLSVFASSGWMKGEDSKTKEPIRNITPPELNLGTSYQWQDLLVTANLYGQAKMSDVPRCSDSFNPTSVPCRGTDSWYVLDINAEYSLSNHLTFNLSVKNLLGETYTRYQDVAGSYGDRDSSQPDRNVSASLRYVF